MGVFLIAEIKTIDDRWVPNYAANVHKLVEQDGGPYLSRSAQLPALEGTQKASQAGSVSTFTRMDDTDVAGAISYLRATNG